MIISVIIITLNEREYIQGSIESIKRAIKYMSQKRLEVEIIISDGGSTDGTLEIAKNLADKVISSPKGRFLQLNNGVTEANGDILLFLHADTILPKEAILYIVYNMRNPRILGGGFEKKWEWSSNAKLSYFLKIAVYLWTEIGNFLVRELNTFPGDNAIFVRKDAFLDLRGFAPLWICEDFDFMLRLKKYSRKKGKKIICVKKHVRTSARRFEKYGFFKIVVKWYVIYFVWRLGISLKDLKSISQKLLSN